MDKKSIRHIIAELTKYLVDYSSEVQQLEDGTLLIVSECGAIAEIRVPEKRESLRLIVSE